LYHAAGGNLSDASFSAAISRVASKLRVRGCCIGQWWQHRWLSAHDSIVRCAGPDSCQCVANEETLGQQHLDAYFNAFALALFLCDVHAGSQYCPMAFYVPCMLLRCADLEIYSKPGKVLPGVV